MSTSSTCTIYGPLILPQICLRLRGNLEEVVNEKIMDQKLKAKNLGNLIINLKMSKT